jgi:hypothetical protein
MLLTAFEKTLKRFYTFEPYSLRDDAEQNVILKSLLSAPRANLAPPAPFCRLRHIIPFCTRIQQEKDGVT